MTIQDLIDAINVNNLKKKEIDFVDVHGIDEEVVVEKRGNKVVVYGKASDE